MSTEQNPESTDRVVIAADQELPFTGILIGPEQVPDVRPLYGDGSIGEPDPTLYAQAQAGAFGHCAQTIYEDTGELLLVPFIDQAHSTPFGPVDEDGFGLEQGDYSPPWKCPASRGESRRRSQGYYSCYDAERVRAIVANEGLEYGINGYSSPENYAEPLSSLGIAARDAISERDDYLYDCEDEDMAIDEKRLTQLARKAESAKVAFAAALGVSNEPWERDDT